ncbi:hypothetical protein niasHS_017124 [Heterodera schachtii]|uniref:B30.2/SPRY domain-containing protein n=1 Tax=Heterodera schachtii TaxID=97005 RepID=A0ABD2I3F9_HETSC
MYFFPQMMDELSSLKTQVEKIGQEQQQQKKEQEEKQEDAKGKYASIDQFTQLQNDQKTLLEKVEQMGSNFTAAFEEQQKKIGVLENFVGIAKERFGKELSKSVHPNFRSDFAEKLSIPPQNCWDANACHENLTISGPNKTTVLYKENTDSRTCLFYDIDELISSSDTDCSLFAKNPIPQENSGIFYYELEILNAEGFISIRLATKAMPLEQFAGQSNGCGYRISKGCGYRSDGLFCIDNFCWDYIKAEFSRGDVVGLGINLATRRLIFTKNGQRLDPSDLFFPPSADRLFPCVSLGSPGDKIEANFGPNFKFDFLKTIPKTVSISPQKNSWDSSACHGDLEITGAEQLVVNYKKEGDDNIRSYSLISHIFFSFLRSRGIFQVIFEWRTVFAKCAVPHANALEGSQFAVALFLMRATAIVQRKAATEAIEEGNSVTGTQSELASIWQIAIYSSPKMDSE